MEIAALNDMVKQARETQSQCQEKHNTQMGSLRASSQEKVMKANQAAAAAEQACLQLQKSASTQIADANKQCHQSEAKSQAVCSMMLAHSVQISSNKAMFIERF